MEERGEGSTKRQHKIMNNLNFHCHHLPVAEGEEKRRVTGEERVLGSREKGHMPLNKHKVQWEGDHERSSSGPRIAIVL